MFNYEYNDYELLDYIAEGNEDAINIMYDKYRYIVEGIAKSKIGNSFGLDYNDLVQEGMIGLSEAINGFRNQRDVTFYTFALLCIKRQIYTAIKCASKVKNRALNNSISLDYEFDDSNLYKTIIDTKQKNPLDIVIGTEKKYEAVENISKKLSLFERKIFDLWIRGYSYCDIKSILNIDYKRIDNAIQRIKKKIENNN